MAWTAVILAAGKGTRMASCKPKALQMLAGRPLIEHILSTLDAVSIDEVIAIHSPEAKKDLKQEITARENITYVEQTEARGTAHAVKAALPYVTTDNVLVLLGDVPLLSQPTINKLKEETQNNDLVVLVGTVNVLSFFF
jgi:bifunctional UDP-N-acetylglucosamine pyrophosphorylase/glucosamine-1-phosphate N-acetyltransferase